jgi:cellobiose-specific phosphotransferase system component IIB
MLGFDYHFDAVSYLNIYENVDKYDVVLLAPQIGYMLNRLKERLPHKVVLQIPTATFASYDAVSAIQFIQEERKKIQLIKDEEQQECHSCIEYTKRILSIAIITDQKNTRIYYRLNDKCEIIDSNLIIKPSMNIYDLYDIIDTLLLRHGYIDIIGIATPGTIRHDKSLRDPTNGKTIDIHTDFENKYNIKVFIYNNSSAAAVGFSLEHPEYKNIIYHTQPFGYGVGGQGIMVNGEVLRGKHGLSGEIRYFLYRMQFSDECEKLALSEAGSLELVTKSLLPSICTIGPQAVAIHSPMTSDMHEVQCKLKSFIPEEFLPEFYYIKDSSSYILDGTTELCVRDIEKE